MEQDFLYDLDPESPHYNDLIFVDGDIAIGPSLGQEAVETMRTRPGDSHFNPDLGANLDKALNQPVGLSGSEIQNRINDHLELNGIRMTYFNDRVFPWQIEVEKILNDTSS